MGTLNQLGPVWDSISKNGRYEPFEIQAGRGQISQHYPFVLTGYANATLGSTAFGPIWEGLTSSGGAYAYPGSASQLSLVSSSASDTSALSVQINGLDANFNPLTEVIALNGTTAVTSVNSYFRVNSLVVTNGVNAGNITAKIGSTLYAEILAGVGQTQASYFTVPAGFSLYVTYIQGNTGIGITSSAFATLEVSSKANLASAINVNGNTVNVSGNTLVSTQTPFVQDIEIGLPVPAFFPAGSDVQFMLKASTGTTNSASIFVRGYLIANPSTS